MHWLHKDLLKYYNLIIACFAIDSTSTIQLFALCTAVTTVIDKASQSGWQLNTRVAKCLWNSNKQKSVLWIVLLFSFPDRVVNFGPTLNIFTEFQIYETSGYENTRGRTGEINFLISHSFSYLVICIITRLNEIDFLIVGRHVGYLSCLLKTHDDTIKRPIISLICECLHQLNVSNSDTFLDVKNDLSIGRWRYWTNEVE